MTAAKVKKNAITGAKVKDQSLTGTDINLAKLGTVPSAQMANSIPPAEPTHFIGAPGEPPFEDGSTNLTSPTPGVNLPPTGFYKDHEGIVYLEGFVRVGAGPRIFTLPPGYRPTPGQIRQFQPIDETIVLVSGVNFEIATVGGVLGVGAGGGDTVSLEGVSFRSGG